MANPYDLDQQTYADAILKYQRAVMKQNKQVTAFNDSFYKDANGAQAGIVNGMWTQNAPADKSGYALWTAPDGSQVLRKPTTSEAVGKYHFYMADDPLMRQMGPWAVPEQGSGREAIPMQALMRNVRGYYRAGPSDSSGWFEVRKASFSDAPPEFTKVQPVKPEGTVSQNHGATAAQVIAATQRGGGLISDVIAGRGTR